MSAAVEPAAGTPLIWRLAPAIFVVFWAGGYSFAKLGLPYVEPFTMLVLRYGFSVVILGGLLAFMRVAWPKGAAHWGALALTGFLIQSVYFGLSYMAFKAGVNAGTLAIFMALQPLLVAGAGVWMWPENRGTGALWLGLVLGFGGVVLVIVSGDTLGASPWVALMFAAGALLGITSATLFEKRHGFRTHPLVGALVQYVVGFGTLLPVALLFETQVIEWHPKLVISLAYLVVGNSLISVTLFVGLVQRGNATRISALLYLVPPLALLIAWVLLGETLAPLAFVGFVISVVGVFMVNRATG
ncbi:DMT family transporter [Rhodobacteraceae bacterium D3-12]|nr:DMT family transporter [Rhodobacteraceae bacterium D3-12]